MKGQKGQNQETLAKFVHFKGIVTTLVVETPSGRRTPMILLRNELGVYGTLTETGSHVLWGHPGDPNKALRRLMTMYPRVGCRVWDDDGHVLRPFTMETL